MKTIKKVSVSPLPRNQATVIDSFNTSDDKHTNAPSINAVEQKMSNVQTATINVTKDNGITIALNFKRNMNLVTINVEIFIPSTVTNYNDVLMSNRDFTMPEWAKTSNNEVRFIDSILLGDMIEAGDDFVGFESAGIVSLYKNSNSAYWLIYRYNQAQLTTYQSGNRLYGTIKYIVID